LVSWVVGMYYSYVQLAIAAVPKWQHHQAKTMSDTTPLLPRRPRRLAIMELPRLPRRQNASSSIGIAHLLAGGLASSGLSGGLLRAGHG
jgi:hypothetical protein